MSGRKASRGRGYNVDAEGQIDRSDMEVERAPRADRKRFSNAADEVVRRLLALPDTELDALELGPELTAEVRVGRTATGPARKRQLLFLSKKLRMRDFEAIDEAMGTGARAQSSREVALQGLEHWRARILDEGDAAIQAFLEAYPAADRQELRQLSRRAAGEGDRAGRGKKALFKALRLAAKM